MLKQQFREMCLVHLEYQLMSTLSAEPRAGIPLMIWGGMYVPLCFCMIFMELLARFVAITLIRLYDTSTCGDCEEKVL